MRAQVESSTTVTVACLQGSVSAALPTKRINTGSTPNNMYTSLYICVELFTSRNPHMTTHLCIDAPQTFLDSLKKLILMLTFPPSWFKNKKKKNEKQSSSFSFEDYIKHVLLKNEYIIVYLTHRITTSPLSFALKYYHASNIVFFLHLHVMPSNLSR